MKPKDLARLRETLRPLAEGLALRGADTDSFRGVLEDVRQRPVYLLPFDLGPEVLGVWMETDTADYIFFEQNTTPYHQRHIVLHEASHMLRGHEGPALPDLVSSLTPHLDPRLVRSLLCHTLFNQDDEAEAEVLATLIEERMDQSSPPRIRRAGDSTVESIARFLRETR